MIIDFSTHVVPKGITKIGIKFPQISALWNMDERLRIMKKYGVDKQVVTITASFFRGAQGDREVELCRKANDEIAKLQDSYDSKFIGLVHVPLTAPEEAVEEVERARQDLGMRGVQLFSNYQGKGLDSKDFYKLYARLEKLGMPIFIHPTDWKWEPYGLLDDYRMRNRLGWPFDTAQAMTRIVFGGVFDKFPNLKIITHHLGSIVPIMMGRLDYFQVPLEGRDEYKRSKTLVNKFKSFYGDTAVNCWALSLEFGYKFFGAKHMVFGSDYPYGHAKGLDFLSGNMKILKQLRMPSSEKEMIWGGNTSKLLNL